MEKDLKWNKQQNLDDENQETTHNIKSWKTTPCSNGPLFLECCKGKYGYRWEIKTFQKLREIEVKQFRIIINGYFCRVFKRLCFVIINKKKSNLSKTRMVRISWLNKSFSRWSNEDQISRNRFCFATVCWNSRFFTPICWAANSIFFQFGIGWFNRGIFFYVFGISGFDGSFKIRFYIIFGFFNAQHWHRSKTKKKIQKTLSLLTNRFGYE